jgi:hypothetical protein
MSSLGHSLALGGVGPIFIVPSHWGRCPQITLTRQRQVSKIGERSYVAKMLIASYGSSGGTNSLPKLSALVAEHPIQNHGRGSGVRASADGNPPGVRDARPARAVPMPGRIFRIVLMTHSPMAQPIYCAHVVATWAPTRRQPHPPTPRRQAR